MIVGALNRIGADSLSIALEPDVTKAAAAAPVIAFKVRRRVKRDEQWIISSKQTFPRCLRYIKLGGAG